MMKVNFKSAIMAVAALSMGLTSCNNEEIPTPGEVVKGEPATMGLSIAAPNNLAGVRALDDADAIADEFEMKTVKVLIYQAETTDGSYDLEQVESFNSDDFIDHPNLPNTYKLNSSIATTSGPKKIHVLMNYTGTVPAIGSLLSYFEGLVQKIATKDGLANSTSGFAMSTEVAAQKGLTPTVANPSEEVNEVTAEVKRMVAKVTMKKHADLGTVNIAVPGGNILPTLVFAMGNVNKTTYVIQNFVKSGPVFVIQDNNWARDAYDANDYFTIDADADYQEVNASDAAIDDLKNAYVPENTADKYYLDGKNLTYVSVRAQFIPKEFTNHDTVGEAAISNPNYDTDNPDTFVKATDDAGNVYYFATMANANAFKTLVNPAGFSTEEYTGGYCYYRVYLNRQGISNKDSVQAKPFDILRNNYYQGTIKSIKGLGNSTDTGNVTEESFLDCNVTVQPWKVVSEDHNLG